MSIDSDRLTSSGSKFQSFGAHTEKSSFYYNVFV